MNEKTNEKRELSLRRIALYIITVCFLYLFAVTFLPVFYQGAKFENNYSNTVFGIILLLIGYYYGSSSGSTIKSETLAKEMVTLNPSTSTTATTRTVETLDKRKTETVTEPEKPEKPEKKP